MYDESEAPVAESEDQSVANGTNEEMADEKADEKTDESDDQMSLVPKQFFKEEPKPGMREMIEVVSVYDGEVSIKCVYGDDDDDSKEEEAEEGMDSAPAAEEEDSMMV